MSDYADLLSILERIEAGGHSEQDLLSLRAAILGGLKIEDRAVRIRGDAQNAVIVTGDGNELRIVHGADGARIRRAVREVLASIEADRFDRSLRDYFRSLRTFCAKAPYLVLERDLAHIRRNATSELYVPLLVRSGSTSGTPLHDEPLTIAEVLGQAANPQGAAHVFIEGAPGSGKSTLLRQVAKAAWDHPSTVGLDQRYLPMVLPLHALTTAKAESIGRRFLLALREAGELMLDDDLPDGFFTVWPRRVGAQWLLLLDGLDEVPRERRSELLSYLDSLLDPEEGQHLHAVITSRAGIDAGLEGLCATYTLQPFTPEQQEEFAARWFGGDRWEFLRDLDQVRVGTLGGTPLLLTVSATVRKQDGKLPERRASLYDRFVDIWLREAEQHGLREELGDRVAKLARSGLEQLALVTTERPQAFSIRDLSQVAAAYLREALNLSLAEATYDGQRFVEVMSRRSGVLVRRGSVCDWAHPTFREYLAASAICRAHEPRDPTVQDLVTHWNLDTWREVVLFLLGTWSEGTEEKLLHDVSSLVRTILDSDDDALLFLGGALAEGVRVGSRLDAVIVDRLLRRAKQMVPHLTIDHPNAIDVLGMLQGREQVTAGLKSLANDSFLSVYDRVLAAEAVGRLGDPGAARGALLDIALDPGVVPDGRIVAAEALVRIGQSDVAAGVLVSLARNAAVGRSARHWIAKILVDSGRTTEAAEILLALASDAAVRPVRRERATSDLAILGRHADAVQTLLALATEPAVDAETRRRAAMALARLDRVEDTVQTLLALATEPVVDAETRRRAAVDLWLVGRETEAAEILLALATEPVVDAETRRRAAVDLRLAGRETEAAEILLALAGDPVLHPDVRSRIVSDLKDLGRTVDAAQVLVVLATNSGLDVRTRHWALSYLWGFGREEELTQALVALANDQAVNAESRREYANSLGRMGKARESARALRAIALDPTAGSRARLDSATDLLSFTGKREVVQVLLTLVSDPSVESEERDEALRFIMWVGQDDQVALALRDFPSDLIFDSWWP